MAGIAAAVPGNHIEDISARGRGRRRRRPAVGVIRQFVGHGIGTEMHEEPQVPNFRTGRPGPQARARAVPGHRADVHARRLRHPDPAPTTGPSSTADGSLAAHFEHSIAVTEDGPQILTVAMTGRLPGTAIFDTLRVRVSARPGRHCA